MKKDLQLDTVALGAIDFLTKKFFPVAIAIIFLGLFAILAAPSTAEADDLPYYLMDRGKGLPTSLFGTYIEKGQFLVYPFYEYTYNTGEEYKPNEFGYAGGEDYKGTTKEHEVLLFLSYGLTDKAPDFAPEVGVMFVF